MVVGLVPAAALGGLWWWSAETVDDARSDVAVPPPAAAVVEQVSAPVLSVRRAPAALSRDVVGRNLRADLDPVVGGMGPSSCLVVETDGVELVDERGAASVIPASNMKLVVAAVALERLGPGTVFTTEVAANVVDGVVSGDLFLVGGGDPLLSVAEYPPSQTYPPFNVTSMEALADRVVLAGVRRITGGVVGDDSRYDDERYVPTWAGDIANLEAGPIGALLVNDGRVYPRDDLPGQDPAEAAAEQLEILLERRGVEVGAPARRGGRDAAAPVIAGVESVPVAEVVHEMLTTSDDNTAESLLKEIGLVASGAGTRAAGSAAVLETLASWGLPTEGIVITDGSGLDRTNVLTCELLVGVLEQSGTSGTIHDALPVAGTTGTLADVFVNTPVQGVLRAKTGTLSGAKSLSGYYPATDGSMMLFSLILNGDTATVDASWPALWTGLGNGLAAYPNGPQPEDLAPPPPAS